jgi:hypothetical protein
MARQCRFLLVPFPQNELQGGAGRHAAFCRMSQPNCVYLPSMYDYGSLARDSGLLVGVIWRRFVSVDRPVADGGESLHLSGCVIFFMRLIQRGFQVVFVRSFDVPEISTGSEFSWWSVLFDFRTVRLRGHSDESQTDYCRLRHRYNTVKSLYNKVALSFRM